MFYGGSFEQDMWTRVLGTNTTMFESGADFFHNPWEAEDIHQMADQGIKINFRIFWWWGFYNGEIAWNTTVVDFYYNSTLMELLEQDVNRTLSYLDMDKIWAVTLSEEEPWYALRYFWEPATLRRYNETYHSETGFWLKDKYAVNKTEELVLNDWLSEKIVSVFNDLYGYVKGEWPHLLVFQFIGPTPGAPPVWTGGIDVSDLKADAYKSDLYYYDVYDSPFWLYEYIRQSKSTFPDKEYHFWLWGEEAWTEGGLAGGFEHIRRNAWVAYLAGVDAIGWFNWHYVHGNIWQREDALGKRLFVYTNRLNNELSKLPPMKPRPSVGDPGGADVLPAGPLRRAWIIQRVGRGQPEDNRWKRYGPFPIQTDRCERRQVQRRGRRETERVREIRRELDTARGIRTGSEELLRQRDEDEHVPDRGGGHTGAVLGRHGLQHLPAKPAGPGSTI